MSHLMKPLIATLCLTIALLLGSAGVSWSDAIRYQDDIDKRKVFSFWVVYKLDEDSIFDGRCRIAQEVLIGKTISDFTIFPKENYNSEYHEYLASVHLYDEFTKSGKNSAQEVEIRIGKTSIAPRADPDDRTGSSFDMFLTPSEIKEAISQSQFLVLTKKGEGVVSSKGLVDALSYCE